MFEVLATGGDSALGGDDLDHALAETFIAQWQLGDDLSPALQRQLLDLARFCKEQLSDQLEVTAVLGERQFLLTRAHFEQLIDPLIDKTLLACRRALRDADVTADEVKML